MSNSVFNKYRDNVYVRKITLSAMFIALASLMKLFSITIPMFGASGMKVGLSGIFTTFPALLFGPIFGGIASACSDIIGHLMYPLGAYNPLYTATAFFGGFLKGVIWLVIKNRKTINMRVAVTTFLLIIGTLAASIHISLYSNGLINGFVASSEEMPSKGSLEQKNYDFLTDAVVGLARYNRDSYTLIKAINAEEITVPQAVVVDGYSTTLRIGEGAFSECASLKVVTIPPSITTINDKAFQGIEGFVIRCVADSEAHKFAVKMGYEVELIEEISSDPLKKMYNSTSTPLGVISNNYSFSKNLAGYINFLTVGLEAVALVGLLFVLVEYVYSRKKKIKENSYGLRVFITIFLPGITVTTLNTVILKYVTYKEAWSNRLFMIVWVPRAVEELLILIIQTVFIAMLYNLYQSMIKDEKI